MKQCLAAGQSAVIAEIKKASPSAGIIRENFDPVQIAQTYETAGATCLSILTDEPYFKGSDAYFQAVKAISPLPLLRKDFIIDSYQIHESRALGADCILLIMACLTDSQAKDFHDLATNLGMDTLIEIHDEQELERALALPPKLLGINNRNLKTMETTLQTSHNLSPKIPDTIFKISESGIKTATDIHTLQSHGYQGFLIGESLMKNENIEKTFKNLLTQNKN